MPDEVIYKVRVHFTFYFQCHEVKTYSSRLQNTDSDYIQLTLKPLCHQYHHQTNTHTKRTQTYQTKKITERKKERNFVKHREKDEKEQVSKRKRCNDKKIEQLKKKENEYKYLKFTFFLWSYVSH